MSDRVLVEIADGVADVRLNRPDKLNALDPATFDALIEAGEALKADNRVRAVVLSGEGRAFSAGLDLSVFGALVEAAGGGTPTVEASGLVTFHRPEGRIANTGQHAAWVWRELPVPVIAAVHGVCFGGGLQIAMGADLRLVAPDAKLSVMEIRWGIVPDMTGTQLLPELVGRDVAKELTFTGRTVSGEEAARLGLATRVSDDPRTEALALAAEIAGKNPAAVRGAKELLDMAGRVSLAEGFAAEERVIRSLLGTPNQMEAVMAGLEQRTPNFADPT